MTLKRRNQIIKFGEMYDKKDEILFLVYFHEKRSSSIGYHLRKTTANTPIQSIFMASVFFCRIGRRDGHAQYIQLNRCWGVAYHVDCGLMDADAHEPGPQHWSQLVDASRTGKLFVVFWLAKKHAPADDKRARAVAVARVVLCERVKEAQLAELPHMYTRESYNGHFNYYHHLMRWDASRFAEWGEFPMMDQAWFQSHNLEGDRQVNMPQCTLYPAKRDSLRNAVLQRLYDYFPHLFNIDDLLPLPLNPIVNQMAAIEISDDEEEQKEAEVSSEDTESDTDTESQIVSQMLVGLSLA
jgi:hypothetical protein